MWCGEIKQQLCGTVSLALSLALCVNISMPNQKVLDGAVSIILWAQTKRNRFSSRQKTKSGERLACQTSRIDFHVQIVPMQITQHRHRHLGISFQYYINRWLFMYSIDILVVIFSKFICLLVRILVRKKKANKYPKNGNQSIEGFYSTNVIVLWSLFMEKTTSMIFFALNCDTLDKIIQCFYFRFVKHVRKMAYGYRYRYEYEYEYIYYGVAALCLASFHLAFHWCVIWNANGYVCVCVYGLLTQIISSTFFCDTAYGSVYDTFSLAERMFKRI